MFKKVKAKFMKDTVEAKLNYLKEEWIEGRATKADVPHWEKNLKDYKESILPYIKDTTEDLTHFEQIYQLLNQEVKQDELTKKNHSWIVFSGLNGDLSFLNGELEKHKKGDQVVVLGEFLSADSKEDAIKEVMRLIIEEEIVFLLGKTEKEQLLEFENWSDVERALIERMPAVFDTIGYSFFADEEGDGRIDLDKMLEGEEVNVSSNLYVYRSDTPHEAGYKVNNEGKILSLKKGLAMRLDFKEREDEVDEQK